MKVPLVNYHVWGETTAISEVFSTLVRFPNGLHKWVGEPSAIAVRFIKIIWQLSLSSSAKGQTTRTMGFAFQANMWSRSDM